MRLDDLAYDMELKAAHARAAAQRDKHGRFVPNPAAANLYPELRALTTAQLRRELAGRQHKRTTARRANMCPGCRAAAMRAPRQAEAAQDAFLPLLDDSRTAGEA